MPPQNKVPREKIRRLAAQGYSTADIARRYGVSRASVYNATKPPKKGGGGGSC